jgi:hypothetical protein
LHLASIYRTKAPSPQTLKLNHYGVPERSLRNDEQKQQILQ